MEFNSAKDIYNASEKSLGKTGLAKKQITSLILSKDSWDIDEQYEKLKRKNINFYTIEDEKYPMRLKEFDYMPYGLYVRGNLPDETKVNVAVVGARNCSMYGRKTAEYIGRELARRDVQIISGRAKGIDGAGHKGAIMGQGLTFGVLGCGVDICYPKDNINIYMDILNNNGGIISELPPETEPKPYFFPSRNRIISGLSDIIIIVEAKEKSGSLITADFALEQGKDVMAVPGRMNDDYSKGCNLLIKQGADIISSFDDIEECLAKKAECLGLKYGKIVNKTENSGLPLEKKELLVYSCLGLEPKNIDEILREIPLTFVEISNIITNLQINGYVEEIAKNNYIISNLN